MLEALWSIQFKSNVGGIGAGVVVLDKGRVMGGDSQYYYVGTYHVEKDQVTAEVKVTHYAGGPHSVFGNVRQFTLLISGKPQGTAFELQGHVNENPSQRIGIHFHRRAQLP